MRGSRWPSLRRRCRCRRRRAGGACNCLSGQYDYQLELVAQDHESFASLVREKIRSLPGVKDIYTSFTLKEVKAGGALPLQP